MVEREGGGGWSVWVTHHSGEEREESREVFP